MMGSNHSSSLRIYASSPADFDSDLAREVPSRLIVVNPPNASAAPPPPLGKGKRKINCSNILRVRISSKLPFVTP